MAPWAGPITDILWRNAIAAIPLAGFVALLCRYAWCRPGTRHILWVTVLGSLVMPPLIPPVESPPLATEYAAAQSAEPTIPQRQLEESPAPPKNQSPTKPQHNTTKETAASLQPAALQISPDRRLYVDVLPHAESCPHHEPTAEPPAASDIVSSPSPKYDRELVIPPRVRIAQVPKVAPAKKPTVDQASAPSKTVPIESDQTTTDQVQAASPTPNDDSIPTAGWIQSVWMSWLAGLLVVRDALGQLSPIPASLWIAGAAAFMIFQLALCLRVVRRIRRGHPATAEAHAIVLEAARELGLRRIPEILMVDDAISPMIWPGRRLQLIIPRPLWNDLDHGGRRAVVIHELAHLRRRDHWWCWLDLLIGSLFWWNPLVWWIRSRMRAEAETCCDAWVTWLLPRDRRAYALALLTTRQYVSEDSSQRAVLSRSILSENAKDFARRITMVMTRTDAPRTTWSTFLLAAVVLAFGWAATPAQSCDKGKDHKHKNSHPVPAGAPEPKRLHLPTTEPTPLPSPPAVFLTSGPKADDGDVDRLEERMNRLEERLERVTEVLERKAAGVRFDDEDRDRDRRERPDRPDRPARAARPTRPAPPAQSVVVPRAAETPNVLVQGITAGKFDRSYSLSEGKLAALTQLMIRQDVPVLVAPSEDEITVNGDAATHEIFQRFVGLIGEEEWRAYELEKGKLDAMYELMARKDVPVYISRKGDALNVKGTPAQHEIFKAFVDLISGRDTTHNRIGHAAPDADRNLALGRRLKEQQVAWAAQQRELAEAAAARQRARTGEAAERAQREVLRSLERQQQALHRQADKLDRKAQEADRTRELLEREAAELRERQPRGAEARPVEKELRNAQLSAKIEALQSAADAARTKAGQSREAERADAIERVQTR